MEIKKISNMEAIALIVIIATNQIILNLPKRIILSTNTSAWLNVICISILALLVTLLIAKLFKKFTNHDILDIANYLGGNKLKVIMGILYLFLLLFSPVLVLRDFSESLKLIYFKNSPLIFVILFFLVGSLIANRFNLKVISKVNLITLPIILISILITLFSTIKNFVPQRIFPILGYGFNETFLSGITNIYGFSGILYLLFLPPLIEKRENFKKIGVISIIISSIYLLLSISSLLLSLSFITKTEEPLSLYLVTRMVSFGSFFQRADALFILLWILSCLSYVSIALFFILHIFKKITNLYDYRGMLYCFTILILALCLIFTNIAQFNWVVDNIYKYSTIVIIFIFSLFILIFANIKMKRQEKRRIKVNG